MRGAETSNPTPCLNCCHCLSLPGQYRRPLIEPSQCNIASDTVQLSHISVSSKAFVRYPSVYMHFTAVSVVT